MTKQQRTTMNVPAEVFSLCGVAAKASHGCYAIGVIYFHVRDGMNVAAATDGARCVEMEWKRDDCEEGVMSAVIPIAVCEMARIWDCAVVLTVDGADCNFRGAWQDGTEHLVLGRTSASKFPNYENVFAMAKKDAAESGSVDMDPALLIGLLETFRIVPVEHEKRCARLTVPPAPSQVFQLKGKWAEGRVRAVMMRMAKDE